MYCVYPPSLLTEMKTKCSIKHYASPRSRSIPTPLFKVSMQVSSRRQEHVVRIVFVRDFHQQPKDRHYGRMLCALRGQRIVQCLAMEFSKQYGRAKQVHTRV